MLGAGVLLPAALAFPVHAGVLGIRTAGACFPVVLLLGAVFVESALTDWRRIPFTCTVLFGKRPAAFTLVVLALSFGAFVLIGTALLQGASAGTTPWLVIVSMLAMVVAALRWRHRHTSATLPFEFTDYLPDALTPVDLR